jgi:alkanesulfonate monooxygenase
MAVKLHWFLPTTGDSRSDLSHGDAVSRRPGEERGHDQRVADLAYLGQVARAAEQSGFEAALTPISSWCPDPWILTAALTQQTERLGFLVAFRPTFLSPTLAAQMAATYQRISGGRLKLNIVVGGEDPEQRRYGDFTTKDERYAHAGEFLHVFRSVFAGETDFAGEHIRVEGAHLPDPPELPEIYLGGSSGPAIEVAARHVDVYLTWGEPPAQVAEKLDRVRAAAARAGRVVRFGIRLHVITRDTSEEAWAEADRLLAGLDPEAIARAQARLSQSQSEGQRRMVALHNGRTDGLEVSPNLWAGVGLVRGGAGTALVGSHEEVADRIAEYHDLGIDEFVLSGYPHLEEAYRVGEGLLPVLRARGLAGTGAQDRTPVAA